MSSGQTYKWKEALEAEKAATGLSQDERKELKRLRDENRELRMEKNILKKASDKHRNANVILAYKAPV